MSPCVIVSGLDNLTTLPTITSSQSESKLID